MLIGVLSLVCSGAAVVIVCLTIVANVRHDRRVDAYLRERERFEAERKFYPGKW